MSKWYSIGFVGACIVFSALPIPYTAAFEAGGLPACAVATSTGTCLKIGTAACTRPMTQCAGSVNNALTCTGGRGAIACGTPTGTNPCGAGKHAAINTSCK